MEFTDKTASDAVAIAADEKGRRYIIVRNSRLRPRSYNRRMFLRDLHANQPPAEGISNELWIGRLRCMALERTSKRRAFG
jgi:hypothetical protein